MQLKSFIPDIDASVVVAAQAGDERAHEAIYQHYGSRLFTLIYRLVPRRAQAEDLLQEVFVDVLRNLTTYTGAGSFGGWLHTIAVNKSLTYLRSPWHRSMLWLDESLDGRHSEAAEPSSEDTFAARNDLAVALRELPPISRAVVWLHDVEGYTHSEIAKALGRTPSFSKSQLARAHLRLRALLSVTSPQPSNAPIPATLLHTAHSSSSEISP